LRLEVRTPAHVLATSNAALHFALRRDSEKNVILIIFCAAERRAGKQKWLYVSVMDGRIPRFPGGRDAPPAQP
jgi:hypothetical protein